MIRTATSAEDFAAFGEVVSAYVGWCRERYAHDAWFVDRVFGHQSLAAELADLAAAYAAPNGRTLLAFDEDGRVCGGGAYRRLPDGTCEMKRRYVHDRCRGHGVGRTLCTALLEAARADGCTVMRLDTGNLLREAIATYGSFGFAHAPPHHDYPEELMPYLVSTERALDDLQPAPTGAASS